MWRRSWGHSVLLVGKPEAGRACGTSLENASQWQSASASASGYLYASRCLGTRQVCLRRSAASYLPLPHIWEWPLSPKMQPVEYLLHRCGLYPNAFFFFLISLFCCIFSFGMQTLHCDLWDLVPWPGIEPGLPALGVQSLSTGPLEKSL